MHERFLKRAIAVLLVLCMCLSCLPAAVFAEEGEEKIQSWTEAEGQTLEDASAQLGEYTPPAEDPEQEAEPPSEVPAEEPEAPAEPTEATEAPAEPTSVPTRDPAPTQEAYAYTDATGRSSADEMTMTATRLRGGETQTVEYILIGCWQQLVALDTYPETQTATSSASATELTEDQRPNVMGPIWRIHETRSGLGASWTESERELVYPGDANLVGAFANYTLYGLNADTTHPNGKIVDPNGGTANGHYLGETVTTDENGWGTDIGRDRYVGGTLTEPTGVTSYNYPKYSLTGDYVIFRNIYMEDANRNWDPLMFYGTMLGVKGNAIDSSVVTDSAKSPLVNAVNKIYLCAHSDDYADLIGQPVISHVTVNQTAKLKTTKYTGVGFFATISSARPGATSLVNSNVKAEVRNLKFTDISVDNSAEGMELETTVVSSLTGFLGGGLGIVLDALLTVLLGKETHFADSLNALLDARRKDPTNMATGAFAGKVDGDVLIENCDLVNVTLSSDYAYVGGFVGYSSGIVQYDGLSAGLDAVLKILTNLLNVIPGLGLGDLVSIVKQVLPLNNLIPVGYYNPYILDCDVNNLHGPNNAPIGSMTYAWEGDTAGVTIQKETEYVGGFIGCKIATVMINDSITDSSYSLRGTRYVGGFAGMARDAVIQELLTDLGVDLGLMKEITERLADANVNLQSVQVRCNLNNDTITVNGTEYLGGFNGAMCNAYCINNEVNCPGNTLTVNGTGDHVGGFAGLATLGYPMSLGSTTEEESLLSTLNKVVTSLASSYGNSLLNLMGVGQSEILGLQFDFGQVGGSGDEVSITGHDFVGGLVGKADALIMGGATEENLEKITYIQDGDLTAKDLFPDTTGGSSLTVSYLTPEGVTAPASESKQFGETVTLPANPGSEPSGYTFAGWVTSDYHNTDAEPSRIYAPNDSYVVTRDVTFRALYQKPGQYVYVLMTEEPDSWEDDYVITFGTYYKKYEEGENEDPERPNLRLLTALADNANYESANSGGATTIEQTAQNEEDRVVWNNGVLSNVPDLYIFHINGRTDASIRNLQTETTPGTYLRVPQPGLIGFEDYELSASRTYDAAYDKWNLVLTDDLKIVVHSDTYKLLTVPLEWPYYLTYDEAGGYFRTGNVEVATNIYLWRKTLDGPYYDTFTIGSGVGVSVSGTVYDNINIRGLKDLSGNKFVGGLAGFADTASVGSLLGDTVGISKYEVFDFSDIIVDRNAPSPHAAEGALWGVSTGLTVTAADCYAGGGIGMAMGGKVRNVAQNQLISVEGLNCAGGFIGCIGPGTLAGTGGLDVSLFGVSLIDANNLLSLAQGMETTLNHVTVTGVDAGYTVEATGENTGSEQVIFCAGGFFGRANSAIAEDCHAVRVQWVKANDTDGRAGGFLGVSQVGGLADVAGSGGEGLDALRSDGAGSLLQASDLLGAVGYLIPTYTNVDVRFVNDSYVKGAYAGGFAADFESGTVDNSDKDEGDWYAVYNIDRVEGTLYAGGFGGKVYSGALADAAGGISVLGGVSNISITAQNLLDLVNYYIPKILYAGVNSSSDTKYEFDAQNPGPADLHNGLIVSVSGSSAMDSKSGAAGGFIGYGSGAEVSYSDVTYLRHTEVTPPAELEGKDGSSYYNTKQSSYAVTSTRYAGGYIGYMDIGSTASLGGGLGILGDSILLDDVTDALDIVSTTIEHSDVNGAPGGFAVLSGAAESGTSSGGSKGQTRDASDIIKVYVVDKTNTAVENFYVYIFKAGGNGQDPWRGFRPEYFGATESGDKVYKFDFNTADYDRVIFNTDSGNYQTYDENCLWLERLSEENHFDGIATVSNNPSSNGWVVGYDISDITIVTTHDNSCRGSYKHYTSARGVESYVETVTNENGEHNFSAWTPVAGESRHYHECAACGYREYENCAAAVWTPVEGQNNHEGDCAKCGQHLTEACTFAAGSDHCSVCGQRSVTAEAYNVGRSGGFAGWIRGGQIQDSDCNLFSYIVGQVAAGGYAGEIEPGSVADVLGNTTVLGGLVSTESSLLSLAEGFVTTIRNSETTCIPCGGAVRADAFSDANTQRGMAGGYVGHNCGGQIWGNNTSAWKEEYDHSAANQDNNGNIISYAYTGYTKECAAIRILSVYGAEYAGGFTGLMESASTADTGSLSLLWGLIDAHNVLGALSIVYPTEENTAVYGPLYGVTQAQWDGWLAFVGQYGGYGMGMKPLSGLTLEVDGNTISYEDMTAEQKDTAFVNMLKQYLYGYHVAAGRDEYSTEAIQVKGGYAGGYVGAMRTGTITNGQAYNAKQVTAMHAAGGFAGEMSAGGAAELGSLSLLGLDLDLTSLLNDVLDVFVPCVKNSSVHGCQSGLTVCAFGDKNNTDENQNNLTHRLGDAGGYVGAMSGGQIWGDAAEASNANGGCSVENLKKVQGVRHVGGYAGSIRSGAAADANTNTDDGLFQGILDSVISTPASLVQLLNATVSTIRSAQITVADEAWGFTVGGLDGELPECAGGFAGSASGCVLGKRDGETKLTVNSLRGVAASEYAGGFVGLADVDGVATVASKGNKTNVLDLLNVGEVSVLDAFRPYIYYADVNGVSDGFTVKVEESEEAQQGLMASTVYTGCAGGFGGAVLDGTVEHSNATQLSSVTGPNYVGGFIGFCGKSGVADVDSANVLQELVGLQAGVGDSFGSTVTACTVTGLRIGENDEAVEVGYTVTADGTAQPTAGGFIGYGDLAQIDSCHAYTLKYVESAGIAGGFIGRTSLGYLVEAQLGGTLLNAVVFIVNELLDILAVGDLENLDVITLNLSPVVNLNVLTDGELLYVDLLGLKIGVALNSDNTAAKVTIGDSYVELPVDEYGHISAEDMPSNLTVRLIRVNHTRTNLCTVTGIPEGYDVFGGGATQTTDGTDANGCAGGFAGLNDESSFVGCQAINCDVVRGTENLVGPFSGNTKHDSVYESQNITAMEGSNNKYNGTTHDPNTPNTEAYETPAKVVLMEDTALVPNLQTLVPETADMQNPCLNSVDLTLHKIWDDLDGTEGLRADEENPVTVSFTVTRVTLDKDKQPIEDSEESFDVTLTVDDASEWTKNVWTKTIAGLPATGTRTVAAGETTTTEIVYYRYSVAEVQLVGYPYITGTAYADSADGYQTSFDPDKADGYTAKITNLTQPQEQTIVVDFGLPVSISVMDYLRIKYGYAAVDIAGIMPVSALSSASSNSTPAYVDTELQDQEEGEPVEVEVVRNYLTNALDVAPNASGVPTANAHREGSDPQYGSFTVQTPAAEGAAATKLRYVPGSMMFDQPIEIAVALNAPGGGYRYTKVKVIPATNIYFEEDFISFTDDGDCKWTDAGTAQDGVQAEDRPGIDSLDMDNIYGYDENYTNGATYSLGTAKYIRVLPGKQPAASFTFKGNGFDLLAITDKTTGYMRVELYRGTEITASAKVASWGIDTFYGYTRTPDKWIRYYCVWDGEIWHLAQTEAESAPDSSVTEENGVRVLDKFPTSEELKKNKAPFIVYKQSYKWEINEEAGSIYNVPVITSRNQLIQTGVDGQGNPVYGPMTYDTYTVLLKPLYYSYLDHDLGSRYYDLYIDGVRVYGPAQGLNETYLQDHEGWPQFMELRKLLTDQGEFGGSSVVFIDGFTVSSISEFQQFGPNHEIYLDPGQSIGFTLQKGHGAEVDRMHFSLKSVTLGATEADYAELSFSSGTGDDLRENTLRLNTAVECYYDLSGVVQWTRVGESDTDETGLILIQNTGSQTISLRNMKVTYASDPGEAELVSVKVKDLQEQIDAALELLQMAATLPVVEDEDPVFAGAAVSLESDLSLHFYIPAEYFEGKTNPYVVFTMNAEGAVKVVSQYDYVEEIMGGVLCRRYSFRNISATQMGDQVTAQVFYNQDGVDHMSETLTYSVKQYAMNMLSKTEDPALRTLLVDMLNYGAEAQKYFGVRTDDLVNKDLSETQQSWASEGDDLVGYTPELSSHRELILNEAATVVFEGASLSLDERVAINYYLDLAGQSAAQLELELTWQDGGITKTVTLDGAGFETRQVNGRTLYVATLEALNATQMRTVVDARVCRRSDHVGISDTMRYSVETYAYSKRGDQDENLRTLILAMMKYGDAASAYFTQD